MACQLFEGWRLEPWVGYTSPEGGSTLSFDEMDGRLGNTAVPDSWVYGVGLSIPIGPPQAVHLSEKALWSLRSLATGTWEPGAWYPGDPSEDDPALIEERLTGALERVEEVGWSGILKFLTVISGLAVVALVAVYIRRHIRKRNDKEIQEASQG